MSVIITKFAHSSSTLLTVAGSMPDLEEFNLQICFTTEMAELRTSVSNAAGYHKICKGKDS